MEGSHSTVRDHGLRKLGWAAMLAVAAVQLGWGTVPDLDQAKSARAANLYRVPKHSAEFAEVARSAAPARCENTRPPEALTTPDPVFEGGDESQLVQVSFIVGTDGRIYSPFILKSGGRRYDAAVLRTVGRWRYRPATCNGIPVDTEAQVQFRAR